MITFEEYEKLSLDQKAELMWVEGTFLLTKSVTHYVISLYAISSFYVEVWYDPQRNEIIDLINFREQSRLEHFLDQINVDGLV